MNISVNTSNCFPPREPLSVNPASQSLCSAHDSEDGALFELLVSDPDGII